MLKRLNLPLSLAEAWAEVEKELLAVNPDAEDPGILHNMKVMYYTGFRHMIHMAQSLADLDDMAQMFKMQRINSEVLAFFDEKNLDRAMRKAREASLAFHNEMLLRQIEEMAGTQEPDACPDVLPPTNKKHLH